jgi:O-antigen/teichoic acid export membrane protein
MKGIRRAFVVASLGRYLVMAINLAATPIMARLLTPADFGIAVLGGSLLAVAEAIRALGGGAYLVQQKDLTQAQMHTNFTISLIATFILMAALLLLVRPLTGLFGRPQLEPYLRVAALGFLAGPISYQISALMSRSLAFGRIAFITTVTAAINASASIVLALLGWGYMARLVDLPPAPERVAQRHELQHTRQRDGHPVPDRRGGALPHHRPDARCQLGRSVPTRGASGLFS